MSNFYIYNKSKNLIGILQNIISVQWYEAYQEAGEAKITARATDENKEFLDVGNRIYNDDYTSSARIVNVEYHVSGKDEIIVARAEITSSLLDLRVVMATKNVTNAESGMRSIYNSNRRALPVELGASKGYTNKVDTQITWGSVYDAIKTIAESSGLGFKVVFDPQSATETFEIYRGVDRSAIAHYIGYFGTDIGNITNLTVIEGIENYRNVVVIAGEGEGASRKVKVFALKKNLTGISRKEMFVDARDIQSEYQIATETGEKDDDGNPIYTYSQGTYSTDEYNALLKARAMEKLAEQIKTLDISCDADQTSIRFGKDYNLGDRMPIKINSIGLAVSARVNNVNTIYEEKGKTVKISFDDFEIEEE